MVKHQGSYVTSLKIAYNTIISYKINNYKYVDIFTNLTSTLDLHTPLYRSDTPWKVEKDLGYISFEDITCLNRIDYDVYGAWDQIGYIILNGIKIHLQGASSCWWSNSQSTIHISPNIYFGNYLIEGHFLNSIVKNSNNNKIHCIAGVMEPDYKMVKDIIPNFIDNFEYWGGADGHIDFNFNFISKRH